MWAGRLGGWVITASHHQRHHDLYRGNYGLYFRFWDRLCGTDKGIGDFSRAHTQARRRRRRGDGAAALAARGSGDF
ncbi:MAG: sterol desaturase family protein, partial [Pseudomonadota bacterium]